MEVQNLNVVGIYESLGHYGHIQGNSTFQCGSQDQEEIPKVCQEDMQSKACIEDKQHRAAFSMRRETSDQAFEDCAFSHVYPCGDNC